MSGPETIHPSILTGVNEVRTGIMNGQLTDQKSIAAATMYCQIRAVEYSKVFAVIGAGFVGVVVATALAWTQFGKTQAALVFVIVAITWAIPSFRIHKKVDKRLTWPELNSLKPALFLPADQAVYLECMQAVDESRIISGQEKQEWAIRLNATLDHIVKNDGQQVKAGQTLLRARDALLLQGQVDSELEQIKSELGQ